MNLKTIPTFYCGKCQNEFSTSRNKIIESNYNISCPKCDTPIDKQMLHKAVNAIGEVEDVNMEFKKFDKDEPYFQLGIKNEDPKEIHGVQWI